MSTFQPTPEFLKETLQQYSPRKLFSAQEKLNISIEQLQKAISEPNRTYNTYKTAVNLCKILEPDKGWHFTSFEDIQCFFIIVPLQNINEDIYNLLYRRNVNTIKYKEYTELLEFYENFEEDDA